MRYDVSKRSNGGDNMDIIDILKQVRKDKPSNLWEWFGKKEYMPTTEQYDFVKKFMEIEVLIE